MAKIEILVQGYVYKEGEAEHASSSAVLVQDKDINIIVDPGVAREKLAEALQKTGLKPDDIHYVVLTHFHPDHALGTGWFPQAKVIDAEQIHDGDSARDHDGFIPDTELAILSTPGHSRYHCSLAVPTDKGMVVIAGDTFWWTDDEEQKVDINKPDPYAQDMAMLKESREKLLKLADFIIPGHGKIIKVK
jgi:glyoxylase-like metal-dependent hydrolase (beta-lactamase superfamily II)